jgi:K+-sensing histidine kinase KdpD
MKSQQENSTVNFNIEIFKENLSNDIKTKIFDTFKALDSNIDETKSINLGLSIAKKIIEKLKGKIFVESNESENIAINISFPNQNKSYV